jgi:putative FmdB family regulatory protein
MPLYEYYCENCDGVFENMRPMNEASLPVPCVQCNRDSQRMMSTFNAFTFRDGYPRRLPDKGTYWHMGKEVKKRAKRMKGYEHPELARPKPRPRPARGDIQVQAEKQLAKRMDKSYRDKWGIDDWGYKTTRARQKGKPGRKVISPG